MTANIAQSSLSKSRQWYRPTISPEHGVYVMLLVSFLTGAAAAQQWTWGTTLALVCGFCGFQTEHPLSMQVGQRKSWKPRLIVWTGIYGGTALAIAFWLLGHNSELLALLVIYALAIAALGCDVISVLLRQKRARWNELVTFAAVCLLAPLAYTVTLGEIDQIAIALWILNTLFFYSTIALAMR